MLPLEQCPRGIGRIIASAALAGSLFTMPAPALAVGAETPATDLRPKISGFAQIDYRRAFDAPDSLPHHELGVRRVRLAVSGQVADRIGYSMTVQGDGVEANTARVLEAYMDFTLASWVTLRAGQAKYDFDVEARESDTQIPLMDRPFITNTVAGSLDGKSTASTQTASARDRGVEAFGVATRGSTLWTYSLGAYQGNGRAPDNNSDFAVTGRVAVEPVAGLRLGGGWLFSPSQPALTPGSYDYSAWTLTASYDRGRGLARVESYSGRRDFGATAEDVTGFYVLGSWTVLPKLDLLARWQQMRDEQFSVGGDQLHSVDVGAHWFFVRKGRRAGTYLAANAMFRNADTGFNRGVTLLNDGRGVELTSGNDVGTVVMARIQADF